MDGQRPRVEETPRRVCSGLAGQRHVVGFHLPMREFIHQPSSEVWRMGGLDWRRTPSSKENVRVEEEDEMAADGVRPLPG
jgi:hypothetical protein